MTWSVIEHQDWCWIQIWLESTYFPIQFTWVITMMQIMHMSTAHNVVSNQYPSFFISESLCTLQLRKWECYSVHRPRSRGICYKGKKYFLIGTWLLMVKRLNVQRLRGYNKDVWRSLFIYWIISCIGKLQEKEVTLHIFWGSASADWGEEKSPHTGGSVWLFILKPS